MDVEQPHKVCKICGQWKPLDAFNKHVLSFDGHRSYCRECQAQYNRRYRAEHSQQQRVYQQEYRADHSEEQRQYDYQRYATDERKAYQREYRARYAEELKEYDRRYNIARSEVKAEHSHKRRARKKAAEGSFSAAEWEALKAHYNYMCLCCNRQEPEIRLEPDHVVPLAQGGVNWISNIQPLCKQCNNRKKTQTIDYRLNWSNS